MMHSWTGCNHQQHRHMDKGLTLLPTGVVFFGLSVLESLPIRTVVSLFSEQGKEGTTGLSTTP